MLKSGDSSLAQRLSGDFDKMDEVVLPRAPSSLEFTNPIGESMEVEEGRSKHRGVPTGKGNFTTQEDINGDPLAGPTFDTDEESLKKNGKQNSVDIGPTFDTDEGAPSKKKGEQKKYIGSPNAQEERLRKLFADTDTDGSGLLDQDEIVALAQALGVTLTKKELRAAMADILSQSSADNAEVDFNGFQRWWTNRDQSSRFGHATASKLTIEFDDLTPECFQGDDVDTKADTTLFLSWTAKNTEMQENICAMASGDNSREAKGQAALQALKEQKCVIDPESKYRKTWDVSQISYV